MSCSLSIGQCRPVRLVLLSVLLVAHACLLAWGAAKHSPHQDEVAHLVAGLSHLEFGNFHLFNVNPPLARTVAAFPVWLTEPPIDWEPYREGSWARSEFAISQRFLQLNGYHAFQLVTIARWACIPFSVAGALFCYFWGRDLWRSGISQSE